MKFVNPKNDIALKKRMCPSSPTIDNKVLPLKFQAVFWGPCFHFCKCAFTKNPRFYQTGSIRL